MSVFCSMMIKLAVNSSRCNLYSSARVHTATIAPVINRDKNPKKLCHHSKKVIRRISSIDLANSVLPKIGYRKLSPALWMILTTAPGPKTPVMNSVNRSSARPLTAKPTGIRLDKLNLLLSASCPQIATVARAIPKKAVGAKTARITCGCEISV